MYMCALFLMSLHLPPPPPSFCDYVFVFFLLEIGGSSKDVGSHLKCLSFYSLNFFCLSAIKRLIVWAHFWLE